MVVHANYGNRNSGRVIERIIAVAMGSISRIEAQCGLKSEPNLTPQHCSWMLVAKHCTWDDPLLLPQTQPYGFMPQASKHPRASHAPY
jgi:hypothetical protein